MRVLQSGGGGYDPVESHVTFAVASWQPYTKIVAAPLFNATFAIRSDGTLWSWGYSNGTGQLGDSRAAKVAATQVGTATNWVDVSVGQQPRTRLAGRRYDVGLGIEPQRPGRRRHDDFADGTRANWALEVLGFGGGRFVLLGGGGR